MSNLRTTWLAAALLAAAPAYAIEYAPCADRDTRPALAASVCARVAVPAARGAATPDSAPPLALFVRKFPAPGVATGSVWLVAGGPGESGATLYPMIEVLRRAFPGFDLLVPDHRGTGLSARLCPREEAVDSPGGTALSGVEWSSCFQHLERNPQLAGRFSITEAAHDLRQLIASSEPGKPVFLYGVSYGTQLALRALQLGALPVDGIVLDSLVPLQTAQRWDLSRRSHVVDAVGRQVLADCDREPGCRRMMGGPAEPAYRRLLVLAQRQPALLAEVPGKDLKRFLGHSLDIPAARARIPYLIKDLERGGSLEIMNMRIIMQQAGAGFEDFAQSPLSIPLVGIISASENNLRPALRGADVKDEEQALLFTSPLPGRLAAPGLPAYARDRYFGTLPELHPPLLVFSGTHDPKTPYEGAVEHATALRQSGQVQLVSVAGAPHFILWTAPECFARHTMAFIGGALAADQHCSMPVRQDGASASTRPAR